MYFASWIKKTLNAEGIFDQFVNTLVETYFPDTLYVDENLSYHVFSVRDEPLFCPKILLLAAGCSAI